MPTLRSVERAVIVSQSLLALRVPSWTSFTCVKNFKDCSRYTYAARHERQQARNCNFTATTVIKICANDNGVRATRNNFAAVNLRYGMHFVASEFAFRKEPARMQSGWNYLLKSFSQYLSHFLGTYIIDTSNFICI
jgi:hypothetical protein